MLTAAPHSRSRGLVQLAPHLSDKQLATIEQLSAALADSSVPLLLSLAHSS